MDMGKDYIIYVIYRLSLVPIWNYKPFIVTPLHTVVQFQSYSFLPVPKSMYYSLGL